MLHTLSFCNAVVQLDVMSTPNKGYFKGNIWEVQLAAAPVPVLVSDTLAGFPRNTQQARGTVAAMLQDVNLPVLLPTSALFRASPASCSEPNKGLPEVDFMREVKYALLSLGLYPLRALSCCLNGIWEEAPEEERLQADFLF